MKQLPFLTKIILVALFLCLNIAAQTSETQKTQTAEEKQKEIEVRKFLASFVKEMDEKKDIRLIPNTFFVNDFKSRFTSFVFSPEDLPKQLSEKDRFQSSVELFNVMYLGLMYMYGNGYNSDSFSDDKDDKVELFVRKIFPPNIVSLMLKNSLLKNLIEDKEDNFEKDFKNFTKVKQLILDLDKINLAFKNHINLQSPKWYEIYQIQSVKAKNKCDYYHARKCEKDDCKGLPPNTIIYHLDSFPFCVEIVEDAGSYKILNIYLRMD